MRLIKPDDKRFMGLGFAGTNMLMTAPGRPGGRTYRMPNQMIFNLPFADPNIHQEDLRLLQAQGEPGPSTHWYGPPSEAVEPIGRIFGLF